MGIKQICIIDDNSYKIEDIKHYLQKMLPDGATKIHEFECINDGLAFLNKNRREISLDPRVWAVITDMQMPLTVGTMPELNGGYEVLEKMERLKLGCSVIVVSSEPVDEFRARKSYAHYRGSIHYKYFWDLTNNFKKLLSKDGEGSESFEDLESSKKA